MAHRTASALVHRILERVPYVRGLRSQLDLYKTTYPPGHYHSPIASEEDVRRHLASHTSLRATAGLELCVEEQLSLLEALAPLHDELPFNDRPDARMRYHFDNSYFRHCDAVFLYGLLRLIRPRRIVEVGSGFSSALMLDTSDLFLDYWPDFVFVDPSPGRLEGLLRPEDRPRVRLIGERGQDVSRETYTSLGAGDVLFIDSSHVAKTGSDVNFLVFEVLPELAEGVVVHFHDVLYPFEYPPDWALRWKGFGWNEAYLLRAFLMFNDAFRVIAFNSYLEQEFRDRMAATVPKALLSRGQSLWLMRSRLRGSESQAATVLERISGSPVRV